MAPTRENLTVAPERISNTSVKSEVIGDTVETGANCVGLKGCCSFTVTVPPPKSPVIMTLNLISPETLMSKSPFAVIFPSTGNAAMIYTLVKI